MYVCMYVYMYIYICNTTVGRVSFFFGQIHKKALRSRQ